MLLTQLRKLFSKEKLNAKFTEIEGQHTKMTRNRNKHMKTSCYIIIYIIDYSMASICTAVFLRCHN